MTKTKGRFPGVEWVRGGGTFIRIDADRCNGCGDCVKVCLAGCFKIEKKKASLVSLDECMECASCWYICDREAISFSWPGGGCGFKTKYG